MLAQPPEPPQSLSLCELTPRKKSHPLGCPLACPQRSGWAQGMAGLPSLPPTVSPACGVMQAWARAGGGGCRLSTTWWALSPQHVPVSSFPPGGRLVASLLKKLHRLREAEPLPRGHTAIQQMTASAGLLFSTFPTWCLQITSSFQGPGAVSLTNLAPLFRTCSQI